MLTDNKTLSGIKSDTERSFLVLWGLIVLISSVIGDTIILVATCRYRVINLHKVIVAIIQHMAFFDLVQSIFRVFPVLTATIADKWILGEFVCHVQDNLMMVSAGFTMILTCALTAVKLIHLKFPLIARTWSKNRGHVICVALWFFVAAGYSPVFIVKIFYIRHTVYFSYATYECTYDHQSTFAPSWYKVYYPVSIAVIHFLSYTILVVTSILILLLANKVRSRIGGRVRLEGTITVLVTVAIQFLSYLPLGLVFVTWMTMGIQHSGKVWRAVTFVLYLNIMANFYIYCITTRSFREFLKSRISQVLVFLRLSSEVKPPIRVRPPDLSRTSGDHVVWSHVIQNHVKRLSKEQQYTMQ